MEERYNSPELDNNSTMGEPQRLEILDNGCLKICRFLGLFPLHVDRNMISFSKTRMIIIFLLNLIGVLRTILAPYNDDLRLWDTLRRITFSLYFFIPIFNVIQFVLKRKQYFELVVCLRKLQSEMPTNEKYIRHTIYLIETVALYTYLFYVVGCRYTVIMDIILSVSLIHTPILVLLQYSTLVGAISNLFNRLQLTLDGSDVTKSVESYKTLVLCCYLAAELYGLQSVVAIAAFIMAGVGFVFLFCVSSSIGFWLISLIFFMSVFLIGYPWWDLIRNCRTAILNAKRFDKQLYRLVILDESKTLVKNKKILAHFKNKRKVEFSAMGLFNFDTPLACSIVNSVTTYIVILIQFSK